MRLKQGASLVGVQWQMFDAAVQIEPIFKDAGVELVITSGSDGKHGVKTLHAKGLALDFRTRDLAPTVRLVVADRVRQQLKPAYDVVLEGDHLHVEYDPKPGESL